MAGEKFYSN